MCRLQRFKERQKKQGMRDEYVAARQAHIAAYREANSIPSNRRKKATAAKKKQVSPRRSGNHSAKQPTRAQAVISQSVQRRDKAAPLKKFAA